MSNIQQLEDLTTQVRRDILRMVHKVNSGHPGGSLGCAEFFVALYQEILELLKVIFKFKSNNQSIDNRLLKALK